MMRAFTILLLSAFSANAELSKVRCTVSVRETLRVLVGPQHSDRMLDVSNWLKESRKYQLEKLGEPTVYLSSIERARKYVYEFPGFTSLGFGKVNKLEWRRVYGRMEISQSFGKFIGWERKLPNGNWARVRIDFSPAQGAHYNIEVRVKVASGSYETHNLAVAFSCADRPCTQSDYSKILDQLD